MIVRTPFEIEVTELLGLEIQRPHCNGFNSTVFIFDFFHGNQRNNKSYLEFE